MLCRVTSCRLMFLGSITKGMCETYWMKGGTLDKYDSHMPNKPGFMHDDYYVSAEQHKFHGRANYYYRDRGRGTYAGVSKKEPKVSGHGIMVCSQHMGKSDSQ